MNQEMLKKLKNMQKDLELKQDEFNKKDFIVERQGVKIKAKGNMLIESVEIDEVLIDPDDKELLEDLLIVAFNELVDKIEEEQKSLAPKMPSGFPF
ncbi:YbaB/EbfC family nucleoid-associated protein [Mycoplasma leonicaptivi]|uniref:YbaB/EbfC family nucleoid-associated protein n=1 Tax=Mycoplasma leonicaptivi TaxID=36742 RepID=UPI0004843FB5|nr:YbaB/EbfC family nucleoid-associated protein [Mycoplasma leonicaptivi]